MTDDDEFKRLVRNLAEAEAWRAAGCPPGPVDMGNRVTDKDLVSLLERALEAAEDICQQWEGNPIATPESSAKRLASDLVAAINALRSRDTE